MTTDTLTPAVETTATAAPTEAAPANRMSLIGLILSIVSIPTGLAPLAIAGVVLGFVGYRDEPTTRTMATWAIVAGFVSLFGWIVFGLSALTFALPLAFGSWALGWF